MIAYKPCQLCLLSDPLNDTDLVSHDLSFIALGIYVYLANAVDPLTLDRLCRADGSLLRDDISQALDLLVEAELVEEIQKPADEEVAYHD